MSLLVYPYRRLGPDRTFWIWILCAIFGYLTFDSALLFVLNPTPLEIDFSELSKERFALRRWVRVYGVELGAVERPPSEGVLVDRNALYGFDLGSYRPGESSRRDRHFRELGEVVVRFNANKSQRKPREFAVLLAQPERCRPEDQRPPGEPHIYTQMARDLFPVFQRMENRGRGFYEGMLEDLDPDLRQRYTDLDLQFASQMLRCGARPSPSEAALFGIAFLLSGVLLIGFLKQGVEDEEEAEEPEAPPAVAVAVEAPPAPAAPVEAPALQKGRRRSRRPTQLTLRDRTRRASRTGFRPRPG